MTSTHKNVFSPLLLLTSAVPSTQIMDRMSNVPNRYKTYHCHTIRFPPANLVCYLGFCSSAISPYFPGLFGLSALKNLTRSMMSFVVNRVISSIPSKSESLLHSGAPVSRVRARISTSNESLSPIRCCAVDKEVSY